MNTGIVNIKGRDYQTVAYRVGKFREAHANYGLVTEVLYRDFEVVVMKASIYNQDGFLLATGHAEEYRSATGINQTSALENAETSAIGRALAALGIGGTEFASANEVQQAITVQEAGVFPAMETKQKQIKKSLGECTSLEELKAVWDLNASHIAAIKAADDKLYNDLLATKNELKSELEERK